jgi:hypothetical protein
VQRCARSHDKPHGWRTRLREEWTRRAHRAQVRAARERHREALCTRDHDRRRRDEESASRRTGITQFQAQVQTCRTASTPYPARLIECKLLMVHGFVLPPRAISSHYTGAESRGGDSATGEDNSPPVQVMMWAACRLPPAACRLPPAAGTLDPATEVPASSRTSASPHWRTPPPPMT